MRLGVDDGFIEVPELGLTLGLVDADLDILVAWVSDVK